MSERDHLRPSDDILSAIHAFAESIGFTPEELAETLQRGKVEENLPRLQKALPAPKLDEQEMVQAAEAWLKKQKQQ